MFLTVILSGAIASRIPRLASRNAVSTSSADCDKSAMTTQINYRSLHTSPILSAGAKSRAISIRRFAWVFSATRWRTPLSPQMQNAALRAFEINMQYARFHIRANELRSALRFRASSILLGSISPCRTRSRG